MESNLDMKLKERLEKDVEYAKKRSEMISGATGVGPEPSDVKIGFMPKAIRTKGQVIAKEEMANARRQINETAREIMMKSGITSRQLQARGAQILNERANKLQSLLLTKGFELKKMLLEEKLDQQESLAFMSAFAGLAKSAGRAWAMSDAPNDKIEETKPRETPAGAAPSRGGLYVPDPYHQNRREPVRTEYGNIFEQGGEIGGGYFVG